MKVTHEQIKPIYNAESQILILGTIPSPKSREEAFYYAHPQNRFWKIMSDLYETNLSSLQSKKDFLLQNHIALWDVLESCEIDKASDSSIRDMTFNDIESLLAKTKITKIYTTGRKATDLYRIYMYPRTRLESIYLPSTSPANCAISYEQLKKEYEKIKDV